MLSTTNNPPVVVGLNTQGNAKGMEELLSWSYQVLRYLNLTRISIGLNEEEQRLLDGLQGAVDRATRQGE